MKRSPRLHVYRRHGEPREKPPNPLFPEYPRLEPNGDVTVLVRADASEWTITQRVPATRAGCPSGARCGAVRCRHHLARVDSQDRSGRPGLKHVKRDAKGKIQSQPGHAGDERASTTIDPWWLGDELPETLCALDAAESGPIRSLTVIGQVLHRHRTLVARILRHALLKLKARGVTTEDVLRLAEPSAKNSNLGAAQDNAEPNTLQNREANADSTHKTRGRQSRTAK